MINKKNASLAMQLLLLLFLMTNLTFFGNYSQTAMAQSEFTDNFDDGVADGWTVQEGFWRVVNGEYSISVGIVENGISTIEGLDLTDCTVETKFRFSDGEVGYRVGIIFRYMKKDTYYELFVSNEYDCLGFSKYLPECSAYGTQNYGFGERTPAEIHFGNGELKVGGKVVGSVPLATISKNVEYTLRVTVTGDIFVGELVSDGFYQRIVWEDTENPFAHGTVGLRARRADSYFDYIKIGNAVPIPKPTLDLSCKSSTSNYGFNVEIKGNLAFDGTAISHASILLSYSVNGGKSWEDLTMVYTASDGSYYATWIPLVTGNFMIKAVYEGDETYFGTSTIVNLEVSQFAEKDVFSVTSNSTVSSLRFDSENQELSFTVTGLSDTSGYVDVYMAKNVISNIEDVKAYLDGSEVEYAASSFDDYWLIHFTYHHSSHEVLLRLSSETSPDSGTTTELTILIGSIIITINLIFIALILMKKNTRSWRYL